MYPRCSGSETVASAWVQRFLCPRCLRTTSVLPPDRLPYRPWSESRLGADFHRRAGTGSGPDPPPGELEAEGFKRAWIRLGQRRDWLHRAFGQLIDAATSSCEELWRHLIRAKGSVGGILRFLAQSHNSSLLGHYRCLRPNPD